MPREKGLFSLLLPLVLCLLLLPGTAKALGGYCGDPQVSGGQNVTWTLADGTLTIGGTGAMADYAYSEDNGSTNAPWYDDRASIQTVVVQNGVTGIGNYAFWGCSGLTSVTIPGSVTSVGNSAFRRCSALTSVTIPDSVTSIGGSAFEGCSGLTGVYITDLAAWCRIPFGFGNHYSNPLYYAHKLYLNGSLLTSLTIPAGVTDIEWHAFYNCDALTSVTIPDSVTSIGDNAFYGCSGLTSVTIPDSVTSIGAWAFYGCSGLKSAGPIGSGCDYQFGWTTTIPANAFRGCSALTSVTIPGSVTRIGDSAFADCRALTSVRYGGTEADWRRILIDSYGNDPLTSATVQYNAVTANALEPLTRSGNGAAVTVSLMPGARLMTAVCAAYDADGRLLDAETVALNEGVNDFVYTPRVSGCAKIKVFVVGGDFAPLLPCRELKLY